MKVFFCSEQKTGNLETLLMPDQLTLLISIGGDELDPEL